MVAVREQGKTSFVREVLKREPQANPEIVNAAWKKAGNEGTISTTLVQKMRSVMGLTGNVRAGRKPKISNGTPVVTKTRTAAPVGRPKGTGRFSAKKVSVVAEPAVRRAPSASTAKVPANVLEQLESDIDRMIFKIMDFAGLSEVETELRRARRLLVRSHQS